LYEVGIGSTGWACAVTVGFAGASIATYRTVAGI
jgi:hypothetical protein